MLWLGASAWVQRLDLSHAQLGVVKDVFGLGFVREAA